MRATLLLAFVLSTVAFGQHAMMKAGSELLDPAREARVTALSKKIRCPVCQGLSIADSNSSMAVAQVDVVRRLVSEGKSDEEIRAYFVARYGEWALLEPKAEGWNLLVWVGPVALLAIGFWVIAGQIRKGKNAPAEAAPNAPAAAAAPPPELADYLQRIRQEVER